MPLWKIHSTNDAFSADDRQAIAKAATAMYTRVGLPDYYVHVVFLPTEAYYNAGEPKENYVTVLIDHVARNVARDDHKKHTAIKDAITTIMSPFTTARGLHLEFVVFETHPFMWRIDGIDPPESFDSEQTEEISRSKQLLKEKFGY